MGTVGSTPERGVEVPLSLIDQVTDLVKSGFNTVKVWTTNATTKRPRQMMDFGHVWAVMEKVAAAGGVLAVHAEDEDIVMFMYRRLHAEGRIGTEYLHEAHNTLSEDLSFRRVIRLAERTGCAIYLMHVSAKDGVDAIAEARRHYLHRRGREAGHAARAFRRRDVGERGEDLRHVSEEGGNRAGQRRRPRAHRSDDQSAAPARGPSRCGS